MNSVQAKFAAHAYVNTDGTLANASPGMVSSSKRLAGIVGEYRVTFDRDVSSCAYSATLADRTLPATEIAAFRADALWPATAPNEVYVNTRRPDGA